MIGGIVRGKLLERYLKRIGSQKKFKLQPPADKHTSDIVMWSSDGRTVKKNAWCLEPKFLDKLTKVRIINISGIPPGDASTYISLSLKPPQDHFS